MEVNQTSFNFVGENKLKIKELVNQIILQEMRNLKEATGKYSIDDFPIGAIVTEKDGDTWRVTKSGMRNADSRLQSDEVYLMPHGRSGIGWDANLDYLNKNVVKIEK